MTTFARLALVIQGKIPPCNWIERAFITVINALKLPTVGASDKGKYLKTNSESGDLEWAAGGASAVDACPMEDIASDFSSSLAYTAGDYVWYEGDLYRFTAAHAAGAWSGSDAIAVKLADDAADLKSAIEFLDSDTVHLVVGKNKFNKDDADVESGACVINTGEVITNAYTTNYYATGYIPVNANAPYLWTDYNIGSTMALAFYKADKTFISAIVGGGASGLVAKDGKVTTPANTAFIRTTGVLANINTAMLVEGDTAGTYEPYEKLNPISIVQTMEKGNHNKAISVFQNKKASFVGGDSLAVTIPNLHQKVFTFSADCTTVGTLTLANGLRQAYMSGWLLISDTNLIVRSYRWSTEQSAVAEVEDLRVAHGLDLTGHLSVTVKQSADHSCEIILSGKNGQIRQTGVYFEGCTDDITAYSYQGTYSNAVVTCYCEHFKKDVWAYGDSYFDMWPIFAIPMGATNVLYDAHTGRNSTQALTSLQIGLAKCLPKKILWCMGMNDPDDNSAVDADWKTAFDTVQSICEENGIEMIACTIPNTPTNENSYKNAYIKASGLRYVDIAAAVGATESESSWYTGLLSTDNVHPSEAGRKVIASAMIAGVPEMLTGEKLS